MTQYVLRIPPEIVTFLRHLHPQIKAKIRRALEEVERDPHTGKPLKKPLEGLYSYRVSDYRIVYQIKGRDLLVEVIDIAKRKIVYQRVANLLEKFPTEGEV